MHIYMLRLDGNKRPRVNDFANFLIDQIVDYCIPPSEINSAQEKDRQYNTTRYTTALFRKAERLFTDIENTGEVGKLALSVLTQSILRIPQVLCKMALKTNPEVHYHGADGVYGHFEESTGKYCLYRGESKIYADVGQALTDCFDSIKDLLIEEGVAYRICQTAICEPELFEEYKCAATGIFDLLANSPAISLAKERGYIGENYIPPPGYALWRKLRYGSSFFFNPTKPASLGFRGGTVAACAAPVKNSTHVAYYADGVATDDFTIAPPTNQQQP